MTRLLLVGGGHAHVEVLRRFALEREVGSGIVVVSPAAHAPYSGMLPGLIAGHYAWRDVHIDLRSLSARAGASLVEDAVVSIDPGARTARCAGGSTIAFDVCSIDVGSLPSMDAPGVREHAIGVKPVDRFLARWSSLAARADANAERIEGRVGDVAVVGAGAGGVEIVLAMEHALRSRAASHCPRFHLVTDTPSIMPTHPDRVRRMFERELARRGVDVVTRARVSAAVAGAVRTSDGRSIASDALFWTTSAIAPEWIAKSGLAVDDSGFLRVDRYLRSTSDPCVFGAGDAIAIDGLQLPKAGVFAVRQAPLLARNLRAALRGEAPAPFDTTASALNLITTGDRRAVMSWNGRALGPSAWIWRWKDRIDRRFMRRYR